MTRFGSSLHPDNTRLVEFERFAARKRCQPGTGKPDDMALLGVSRIIARPSASDASSVVANRTVTRIQEMFLMRWHHDIWRDGLAGLPTLTATGLQRPCMLALHRRPPRARFNWKRLARMTEILWPRVPSGPAVHCRSPPPSRSTRYGSRWPGERLLPKENMAHRTCCLSPQHQQRKVLFNLVRHTEDSFDLIFDLLSLY